MRSQSKEWQLRDWIAGIAASAAVVFGACAAGADVVPPEKKEQAEKKEQERARQPGTASVDGQSADPVVDLGALEKIDEACWSELRNRRIYFAHQAIGSDILAGLRETMVRKPATRLAVVAYAEPDESDESAHSAFDTPGLVEASAGRRGNPDRKIEEFVTFLRSDEGAKVDIAILKFCYGDIGRMTNPAKLAERYAKAVDEIRQARPNVHLIHCTVPLKAEEHGAKGRMKRLVGAGSDASNAVRARYNDEIRRRFPAEQILDIARAESRRVDGTESAVEVEGKRVQTLAAEYTEDGAHLNRLGQIVLAREFLVTLARQCGGEAEKGRGVAGSAAAESSHAGSDDR